VGRKGGRNPRRSGLISQFVIVGSFPKKGVYHPKEKPEPESLGAYGPEKKCRAAAH
jgi:hypothetical protein